MTPALQQLQRSNLKRSAYVPPEVWLLVFFQNTDPSHLYTVGRQVCSVWRTEIPKVIAKKYLEDPTMVQIHADCETSWCKRYTCLLGHGLGFSHYAGVMNDRIVFKPMSGAWGEDYEGGCTEPYIQPRNNTSQSLPAAYNCPRYIEQADGKHFDLPPRQIRIKWDSNYTELLALEVDFDKAEISFEWGPMLELFYREVAQLDRRYRQIAAAALQWLKQEDRTMTAVFLRTWKDQGVRREYRRELRHFRIKTWYCDVHNHEHAGDFDYPLLFQTPERVLGPCAEDKDEARRRKVEFEAYEMLRRMTVIADNVRYANEYGDFLRGAWETLSARVWSAETLADEEKPTEYTLFDDIIPRVVEDQTDDERALISGLEDPFTKAERAERHEREKHYCKIWLGRSRMQTASTAVAYHR